MALRFVCLYRHVRLLQTCLKPCQSSLFCGLTLFLQVKEMKQPPELTSRRRPVGTGSIHWWPRCIRLMQWLRQYQRQSANGFFYPPVSNWNRPTTERRKEEQEI